MRNLHEELWRKGVESFGKISVLETITFERASDDRLVDEGLVQSNDMECSGVAGVHHFCYEIFVSDICKLLFGPLLSFFHPIGINDRLLRIKRSQQVFLIQAVHERKVLIDPAARSQGE